MLVSKKDNICIIPARGGSKRIPSKNIKKFNNIPIIIRSIKKAIKTKLFDKIIVSTDNKKIANISKKYGAEIHKRSKKLSNDHTDTISVIRNVILYLESKDFSYKKICCIYPTSIFYDTSDILKGFNRLSKNKNYVISATRYEHPIHRAFYKKGKNLKMVFKNAEKKRTQDLLLTYHDAAQFYFGWRNSWVKRKKIFSKNVDFVKLPKFRSQDFDEPIDWVNAEFLWKFKSSLK